VEYWIRALERFDIPFAVLPTYEEAANDPQKRANGIVVQLEHPKSGSLRTVNSPFEVAGFPKEPPRAAPELGQHTCAVLGELGYGPDEIQRLIAAGIAEQYAATEELDQG